MAKPDPSTSDTPASSVVKPVQPPTQLSALSGTVADLFAQNPAGNIADQKDLAGVLAGRIRSPRADCAYHIADFTCYTPESADAIRANLATKGWRPISGPYYRGAKREDAEVVGIAQAEVYVMDQALAQKRERQQLDQWLKNKRFRDLQAARRSKRGMLPS